MIIELIDPRDIEHEVDQAVYRVYFWHRPPPPPGVTPEDVAYHCGEYRVDGAVDVHEVMRWATMKARPEQTFVLYLEHLMDGRPGLTRLVGQDPNR